MVTDESKKIYIIIQPSGYLDTYYENEKGWTDNEEEAKKLCKWLDEHIPQMPDKKLLDIYEKAEDEWLVLEDAMMEEHSNPGCDYSKGFEQVVDHDLYIKGMKEFSDILYRERLSYFSKISDGQITKEFIDAYDAWEQEQQDNTGNAFYRTIKKVSI